VANSFKETLKKAYMFEVAVGRGRLFVCSLNVYADDPAARWLLHLIYDYCAGAEFRPRHALPREELAALLVKKPRTVAALQTDMADDPRVREWERELAAKKGKNP
jgi:hypothetical protein